MGYGTKLKPRKMYAKLFSGIKSSIQQQAGDSICIEHVGGTSLQQPVGKGDIDIYVKYRTKKELKRLSIILTKLFGKPGKVTPTRIRFKFVLQGIDIEVQLLDKVSFAGGVALREYLNHNPKELTRYVVSVGKLRRDYLSAMFALKKGYIQKATA